MNREQLESQLSAMYDGELPAAECELLARRLVREEPLRATWSRYALIGAALRAEPRVQVRPGFHQRIGAQLDAEARASLATRRRRQFLRRAGLGTGIAAGVAGAALLLLRHDLVPGMGAAAPSLVANANAPAATTTAAPAAAVAEAALPSLRTGHAAYAGLGLQPVADAGAEPASYVVPPTGPASGTPVPASLAGYVLAHSEVSSPLARRGLISTLVAVDGMAVPVQPPGPQARAAAGASADAATQGDAGR